MKIKFFIERNSLPEGNLPAGDFSSIITPFSGFGPEGSRCGSVANIYDTMMIGDDKCENHMISDRPIVLRVTVTMVTMVTMVTASASGYFGGHIISSA